MSMQIFDMVVRNGRIVSEGNIIEGCLGITDGKIAAIAEGTCLAGKREIDAMGRWVLPGGIDSHCHIEQMSGMGRMSAGDFYSATVSAAYGGTTTIIPFAAQHRGASIPNVVADYKERARKSVIDYGIHLIVSDPTEQVLMHDLPQAIRDGISSVKVYMTYDSLKLADSQLLDIFALARHEDALVMVHAENNDIIKWLADRLLAKGYTLPKYHAVAHDPLAEAEATNRAIILSRVIDVPILLVHVSGAEAIDAIRRARLAGLPILAESCPQYLFLTADDLDRDGMEGAKFCCSPPPRDPASQEAVWHGFIDTTLTTYSSDHAPYRFDKTGKLPNGEHTTFKEVANGVPGLELRLPLLFSEGFLTGRIDIHQFVALTATNHAKLYGLAPRKGAIVVGADADIAIWDENREVTVTNDMLHDEVGYTPYEGKTIRGWPQVVLCRGRVIVDNGALVAERGSGQYLPRKGPQIDNLTSTYLRRPDARAKARSAFLATLVGA